MKIAFLNVTFQRSDSSSVDRFELSLRHAVQICRFFDCVLNPSTINELTFALGNVELPNAVNACVKGVSLSKYAAWLDVLANGLNGRDFSDDTLIRLYLLNRVFYPVLSRVPSAFQYPGFRETIKKLNAAMITLLENPDINLPYNMGAVMEQNIFIVPDEITFPDLAEFKELSPLTIAHNDAGHSSFVGDEAKEKQQPRELEVVRELIDHAIHNFVPNAVARSSPIIRKLLHIPANSMATECNVMYFIVSSPLHVHRMFIPTLDTALSLLVRISRNAGPVWEKQIDALLILICNVLLPIATTLRVCSSGTLDLLNDAARFSSDACNLKSFIGSISSIDKQLKEHDNREKRRAVCSFIGGVKCNVCGMAYHQRPKHVDIFPRRIRVECANHSQPLHGDSEDFSGIDVWLQLAGNC